MNSTPPEVGIEKEYSQGVCEDGAAILCDGQPLTIEEILQGLRERDKALGKLSAMESKAKQLITNACCTAVEKLTELAPNQGWDSGDVVAEMYIRQLSDKPVPADKPTRITEQDAREIISSYEAHYKDDSGFDWWFRENGPALLNKLNADREQVPAVAVPNDCRIVAASDLRQIHRDLDSCQKVIWLAGGFDPAYCTDAQKSLKLIDVMLAAAPSHSQQSADAVKAFCKDIGLYDPEYDDQGYIEVSRYKLREHVESLYDRCPSHESEQPDPDSEGE